MSLKRIVFLLDYKGAETNQLQYLIGQIAMFPAAFADRLISDKIAEEYVEPKPAKKDKVSE